MLGRCHRSGCGVGGGGGGGGIRHHSGNIPLNRNHVFDSSGPDLRVRGTAQQLFERYLQLGRDASSSGDRVMAESYFQHAEHYFRILNAMAQATQNGGGGNGGGERPSNGSRETNQRRPTMEGEGSPPDDDQPDPLVPQSSDQPTMAPHEREEPADA